MPLNKDIRRFFMLIKKNILFLETGILQLFYRYCAKPFFILNLNKTKEPFLEEKS